MSSLTVRLFGSYDCEKCKAIIEKLETHNIKYLYVDAFADENQDLCDKESVYDLPHIQIFRNNVKVYEIFGESLLNSDVISIIGKLN